ALLLRLAAMAQQRSHDVHLRMACARVAAGGVDFLEDDRGGPQRQARAAVGLRDEGREPTRAREPVDERFGIGVLVLELAPVAAGKIGTQHAHRFADLGPVGAQRHLDRHRGYEGFASQDVLARMARSSFHTGWSRGALEKRISTWLRSPLQSRCVISILSSSASPLEKPFQVKRRPPEAMVHPSGAAIGCSETDETVPGSSSFFARVAASMRPSKYTSRARSISAGSSVRRLMSHNSA